MAWKWFWNTETKYYDEEITRDTDWGGDESTDNQPVSGGRIQEWLKNELNGRYGYINLRFNDAETMYYIECFATKEDYELFEESGDESYRLQNIQIPISTVKGDTYTAMLRTSLSNSANIVVSGNELNVPLNFRAIKISVLGNENAGYKGTLTIQRSTDGGESFITVGTMPNALTSMDYDSTEEELVNIGEYLTTGNQMIRIRASYTYENEEGDDKIVNSSYIYVGASVTKTSLRLELRTPYYQPMASVDINGNANPFSVMYGVYGSVQKRLYVRIKGSLGTNTLTYDLAANIDSVNQTVSVTEDSAYGYMTHGVKKVEAWLECEDGLGNTLKSDVLVNRFMVVNEDSSTYVADKAYLLLQNVDGEIDNFEQTEIAQYAVYNPSGEDMDVVFLLTDYAEQGSTYSTEYFRMETSVTPNTENKLLTTIEIENEDEGTEIKKYDTYFRVRRVADDVESDFMYESTAETNYYIVVNNENAFTPVSGATFLLNPKTRNNKEDNPARILNAKNDDAEVDSVWENFGFINDGWMTAADGQKVLRVMAGSKLTISRNVWKQFLSTPNSSLTFEIDYKVSNVTNTTDPIIQMYEGTASSFKGVKMNALEGWIMNGSNTTEDNCLFAWDEDKRVHLAINLNNQVFPNKGDVYYHSDYTDKAQGSLALARVLIDGDPVREIPYKTDDATEWCTTEEGSIVIGNDGADIDIYSIRIYEGKQIEMNELLNRNYLASLSTSDEKQKVFKRNNLLDGGLISLEKTKQAGLNCYIWHGTLPYHSAPSEPTGWLELFRYDDDGNYLPEYSGKICETTKSLQCKGQGSTAKTYYDWNIQEDGSKVKATIQVSLDDIHEEIVVGSPYTGEDGLQYVDIYGGNLGNNAPIEIAENAKPYPYSGGMVTVPDGWIDGNGKYRGTGYRVAEGTSLAQKRVIKINYASSMQNHLLGACKTYDLLHRKVVGNTPLQEVIPTAVSAKHQEPFMMFNEDGTGTYFKGMGTYGAGKADKVTWGFVKKEMPMYALIEGSDNNLPMTGFRVPFDKNTAVYDVDGEGWVYNGQQSFDFDLGNVFEPTAATESDGWKYILKSDDNEAPTALIRDRWADIHNFIYLHSTNLKYYNGTFDQFKQSDAATDTDYKYWCTQGDDAFRLKRYDFIGKEWVNAGLSINNNTYYNAINLSTFAPTNIVYNEWVSGGTGDYALLNEMFKDAYVAQMKAYLKYFINEKSLMFNYCYVLGFLAGTDNSDKNTYYKIMPYSVEMEEESGFASWYSSRFGKTFDFSAVYQLYFDGDDMDSILRTNNNSHQTKPYYIDRMHPYADGSSESLYEGMGNQLFNYVEKAYEGTNELSSMMKQILDAATELVSEDDRLFGLESNKKSLWGFLHKYFFNIQYYFPQIAYMEQARIRYEFPKLLGFISSGGGARNIDPITQSLGSQLRNELQYMNQRAIYMTSYAGFGAWSGDTLHSIGLSDANETFGFTPAALPDGSGATYTFTIKPHQYIYPSYYNGQTFTSTHQRTAPSGTCTFTIAENVTTSDSGMGICGINYISDLGDFTDKSITGNLVINGKRLTRVYARSVSGAGESILRPNTIEIGANNVSTLVLFGIPTSNNIDVSSLVRLQSIDVRGSRFSMTYPQSSVLESIQFGSNTLKTFELRNVPNLRILTIYTALLAMEKIGIYENVGISTQPLVETIHGGQLRYDTPNLQSIHVENVNWVDFGADVLDWYCGIPTCEFKGTISIKETDASRPAITWDLKNRINAKFGVVDTTNNAGYKGLLLKYAVKPFDAARAKIKGNFYVESGNTFQFEVRPYSIYENAQYIIQYRIRPVMSNITINGETGILTVRNLPEVETRITVYAYVYVAVGDSTALGGTIEKEIEIWNRPAQVGDLVYHDGTFSSAATYDGEKSVVGMCCYVAPRKEDGTINETFHNPNDVMTRLMVATDDVKSASNTEEFENWQWGVFPVAGTEEQMVRYSLYSIEDGNMVNLKIDEAAIVDVPNLRYLTQSGLTLEDGTATNYINDASMRDESTIGLENDGFKAYDASVAIGDGFAYNENATYLNERKLTDANGMKALAGDYYKAMSGDVIVNSGYAKTLRVIAHRDNILRTGLSQVGIGAEQFAIPSGTDELGNLAQLMTNLRNWAKSDEGLGDEYGNRWSQLYFPAASACYAYEPNVKDGEVLATKFTKHHWFLPTEGVLARLFWYTYVYTDGVLEDKDNSPFYDAFSNGVCKKFLSEYIWSVNVRYIANTWNIPFFSGSMGHGNKYYNYICRAICAF